MICLRQSDTQGNQPITSVSGKACSSINEDLLLTLTTFTLVLQIAGIFTYNVAWYILITLTCTRDIVISILVKRKQ